MNRLLFDLDCKSGGLLLARRSPETGAFQIVAFPSLHIPLGMYRSVAKDHLTGTDIPLGMSPYC